MRRSQFLYADFKPLTRWCLDYSHHYRKKHNIHEGVMLPNRLRFRLIDRLVQREFRNPFPYPYLIQACIRHGFTEADFRDARMVINRDVTIIRMWNGRSIEVTGQELYDNRFNLRFGRSSDVWTKAN